MTEVIFATPSSLLEHLRDEFHMELSDADIDSLNLLHAVDCDRLKQLHYRLSDGWEKTGRTRKAEVRHQLREHFIDGLHAAVSEINDTDVMREDLEELESIAASQQSPKAAEPSVHSSNSISPERSSEPFRPLLTSVPPVPTFPVQRRNPLRRRAEAMEVSVSPTKRPRPPPSLAQTSSEGADISGAGGHLRHLRDGQLSVPWVLQIWLASMIAHHRLRSNGGCVGWSSLTGSDYKVLRESDAVSGAAFLGQRLCVSVPLGVQSALRESDREECALAEHKDAGLGLQPDGWYGGKVHFRGQVSRDESRELRVTLLSPQVGTSMRFARRFGSSAFMRLKIEESCRRFSSSYTLKDLEEWLCRPLCILGRRFVPVYARETILFLLRVDETVPELSSLAAFLDWHGGWDKHRNSALLKYMQRTALGLSTSVPGLSFQQEQIHLAGDIEASPATPGAAPVCLSDGAAPISTAAMRKVARALEWRVVPSALQARLGGAKGVWFLDHEELASLGHGHGKERIFLRPSQIKLKRNPRAEAWDPACLALDVLGPARLIAPSALSQQILFVLSHNGVPSSALIDLLRRHLRDAFEEMTCWEAADRLKLADVIDTKGGITASWAKEAAAYEARARGIASRLDMDDREEAGEGRTETIFGVVYEMLLRGFVPSENFLLAEKLSTASAKVMDRLAKKFQIPVPRSAELMVIPDPTNQLEEGQISVHFSQPERIIDPDTKMATTHLVGPVLVTRHPCLLPTDIRKVEAVVLPALAQYRDVIVFPTRGRRPLADLLSGGDYDGDLVRVIFEPSIVTPFSNADLRYSMPPEDAAKWFERDAVTVADFLDGTPSPQRREQELVRRVVRPLCQASQTGTYGILHRNAAYIHGLSHKFTLDLAHKFSQVLDGSKTGVRVQEKWFRLDKRDFDFQMPDWASKEDEDVAERVGPSGKTMEKLRRRRWANLAPSIHDQLVAAGKETISELQSSWRQKIESITFLPDEDLLWPWREALVRTRLTGAQVRAIEAHVLECRRQFEADTSQYARARSQVRLGGHASATSAALAKLRVGRDETRRQYAMWRQKGAILGIEEAATRPVIPDAAEASSTPRTPSPIATVASSSSPTPPPGLDALEMERLRLLIASCAYSADVHACLAVQNGGGGGGGSSNFEARFALEVAFEELCELKARSRDATSAPLGAGTTTTSQGYAGYGGFVTYPRETSRALHLNARALTRLRQAYEEGGDEVFGDSGGLGGSGSGIIIEGLGDD